MAEAEIKSNTQREIQVEIPADIVARETEAVVSKFQKLAKLPGFRQGKVPASVVRNRFSEDIKSEVVESLIPRYFRQETEKQNLHPVSQPRVTDLHIHEGEPLRFKASFEVLPDFDVTGYEDIHVDKPDTGVTDEEVDKTLQQLREQNASFNAIDDRALQDGDFAQVAFSGTPKGTEGSAAEGQPVNMDDVLVEIGGSNTLPEFTENLRGANPNDQRTFEVTYHEDFSDKRLAGKTFEYSVTVKGVKQKHLPELNDDFAKELGQFADFNELRQRVRENLEAEKKHNAEHEAKDKIVDELLKRNEIAVPESMIEHQIDVRLERGLRALAQQGMRPEDMKKMDFGRLRAGQRDQAEREVKIALMLEKIAEKEDLLVSDQEVDREVEALALQAKQPVEAVRNRLTQDGGLARIRSRIRSEKTLDFLYNRSA
ncbi:MAG TPA: trigger factor [Terriglobales bacterium]|nr:trigger factor [Terriglobales bacterium]